MKKIDVPENSGYQASEAQQYDQSTTTVDIRLKTPIYNFLLITTDEFLL
jgi:hypothetical protein